MSRKRCQQWVNDCPICHDTRSQTQQNASILHDIDSIDYSGNSMSVVPTLDLNFLHSGIKDSKTEPKLHSKVLDHDLGMPTPKRLKSDAKTPFVSSVDKADKKIRQHVIETPLIKSDIISQRVSAQVYLKCENDQVSGCFKTRGTFNKVIIEREKFKKGGLPVFITASTGNHALALVKTVTTFGMQCQILLPSTINENKLEKLNEYLDQMKVTIRIYGDTCLETELEARSEAHANNLIYVSPYNDLELIHGHATIAPELMRQMKKYDKPIDYILVPAGGGGLLSGIATYFKELSPFTHDDVKIVGVLTESATSLLDYVKGDMKEENTNVKSFSDATLGGVEMNSMTIHFCKKYVDDWILVNEEEIESATWDMIQQNKLIEGSGALALAALYKEKDKFINKNVIVVLTGGNIGIDNLNYIMSKHQGTA